MQAVETVTVYSFRVYGLEPEGYRIAPFKAPREVIERDYASEFSDIFGRGRLPAQPTVYVCAQDRGTGSDGPAVDPGAADRRDLRGVKVGLLAAAGAAGPDVLFADDVA